ncbi:Snf12p RNJ42_03154 [Nakaseomyces bracarensis]|uniref:Snf12p n=1 Tax=Nakaseomyces bracarensis TaxID=273131 RepID=UPI0038729C0F
MSANISKGGKIRYSNVPNVNDSRKGESRSNSNISGSTTASHSNDNSHNTATSAAAIGHPSDTYIPPQLSKMIPGLRLYEQLLEEESKIDAVIKRRKVAMEHSIQNIKNNLILFREPYNLVNTRNITYLRVFISSVSENQMWQNPDASLEDGAWTMRIEGRLIDSKQGGNANRDKFSTFIDGIKVEFKKPKTPSEEEKNDEDDDTKNNSNTANNESSIGENNTSGNDMTRENSTTAPFTIEHTPNTIGNESSNPPTVTETGSVSEMNTPFSQSNERDEFQEVVEWKADPRKPVEFDGFDIKRNGTTNIETTVTIYPKSVETNRYFYSPELASIIGLSQGSKTDAIFSLYKYVQMNDLLVSQDYTANTSLGAGIVSSRRARSLKNVIQLDESLSQLFSSDDRYESNESLPSTIKLTDIPSLVEKNIESSKPVKINYTVRVDKASTYGEVVFDVEVPTKELIVQQQQKGMNNKVVTVDKLTEEVLQLLAEYDGHITKNKTQTAEFDKKATVLHAQLNSTRMKHGFYKKFSDDPVNALKEYIESTSNALKVLSGDEGFLEDNVRRSQFYKENEDILKEDISILLKHERL